MACSGVSSLMNPSLFFATSQLNKGLPFSAHSTHSAATTTTTSFGSLSVRVRASSSSSEGMATVEEKLGIKIERNPPDSKLTQLGVRSWPKWGCPPSKFPWTYSAKETCYLLEGKVKVTPDGANEAVQIGAGDLVVFPKGMSCTWDVSVAVDKHYKFE
ncbi:uncharacterized protein LOC116200149 [Punica granatum]|uniref:Uncharacterized protein LOC116200149 n=2 Tax=Punica granatum TaxID=22663 RepID=A0A218VYT2_PUNGR|nr:uncharacterized protein LOC116200149 [Punica granatum]OWM65714.1 hypothetical protein CDL15_Pgr015138 [Punica granatum]